MNSDRLFVKEIHNDNDINPKKTCSILIGGSLIYNN